MAIEENIIECVHKGINTLSSGDNDSSEIYLSLAIDGINEVLAEEQQEWIAEGMPERGRLYLESLLAVLHKSAGMICRDSERYIEYCSHLEAACRFTPSLPIKLLLFDAYSNIKYKTKEAGKKYYSSQRINRRIVRLGGEIVAEFGQFQIEDGKYYTLAPKFFEIIMDSSEDAGQDTGEDAGQECSQYCSKPNHDSF